MHWLHFYEYIETIIWNSIIEKLYLTCSCIFCMRFRLYSCLTFSRVCAISLSNWFLLISITSYEPTTLKWYKLFIKNILIQSGKNPPQMYYMLKHLRSQKSNFSFSFPFYKIKRKRTFFFIFTKKVGIFN